MSFTKKFPVLSYTLLAALVSHSFVLIAVIFAWLGPSTGVGGGFC